MFTKGTQRCGNQKVCHDSCFQEPLCFVLSTTYKYTYIRTEHHVLLNPNLETKDIKKPCHTASGGEGTVSDEHLKVDCGRIPGTGLYF